MPDPAELRTTFLELQPANSPRESTGGGGNRLQREVSSDLQRGSRGPPASTSASCVCTDVGLVPKIWQRKETHWPGLQGGHRLIFLRT